LSQMNVREASVLGDGRCSLRCGIFDHTVIIEELQLA